MIKAVRNTLKDPLGSRHPVLLSRFERIGRVGGEPVLEDTGGQRVALSDFEASDAPATCHLLRVLPAEALSDAAVLLRFAHELDAHRLVAKPVSIVTDRQVLRLEL